MSEPVAAAELIDDASNKQVACGSPQKAENPCCSTSLDVLSLDHSAFDEKTHTAEINLAPCRQGDQGTGQTVIADGSDVDAGVSSCHVSDDKVEQSEGKLGHKQVHATSLPEKPPPNSRLPYVHNSNADSTPPVEDLWQHGRDPWPDHNASVVESVHGIRCVGTDARKHVLTPGEHDAQAAKHVTDEFETSCKQLPFADHGLPLDGGVLFHTAALADHLIAAQAEVEVIRAQTLARAAQIAAAEAVLMARQAQLLE
eukprot:TRINITY_DN35122_c0_g1_i1.p1 TRINITY_DN35122_c0_g1~~TRINITY_DN35122_c0_g1_i1.p1  ORF type:complete len:293 (-),score=64.63 TRINITY_DN35122_c0_g1_i1:23-790(-)